MVGFARPDSPTAFLSPDFAGCLMHRTDLWNSTGPRMRIRDDYV